ncbi:precorrin-6y C5,15-methyltransferase (decarboxylating) subunit CbiE [Pseudoflavonifractor sp. BIOML-A6]|nr:MULTISPECIES: precorrin-6y C5,15-methyltransferase (decarboxylating) subunit CbiE [unclassified Pseudoflavonifractor]MTQ96709.1 precorrin-6y C5,15-methyltransferase (decarboxylating) subunit CbiE [Pseudoflavonifractor sp. BIOML-A16]MTR04854.1 precorrin-6y C5,15-methyltransferase (decarboxylating) subunit CbiE [Pseudoflavonifractor sp. BIOML-A15]MTR30898.1 precorrin-6y C5,15-methyltransferase (decarboxylating) subunit CbiE [Pseudoflavonifractor sp. BIOML-A14]MTR71869.1 precorrin-6y C5,15-meth
MKGRVYLIGMGMGNPETLTAEASAAIEECDLLLGATRLVEPYIHSGKELAPLIAAADIAAKIGEMPEGTTSGVLLSGDVGFYSGARGLYALLTDYEVLSIPGISSLSYFCARICTAWQDVHIVSAHGRSCDCVGAVRSHGKTFLLTGGDNRAQDICAELAERGMGELAVWVGERLSYPDEAVSYGTAADLARKDFDSLAVMLVANPAPVRTGVAVPGISDDDFLRGDAPMTKEEVRTLALSKLHLYSHHILWDVGAGTGSVSIQGALAVPDGQVYAVEREQAALELMAQNKAKFGAGNLKLVAGEAPEALQPLPAPDRVFLGGTSGSMAEILGIVFDKNPAARVVVTAVTLETLAEATRLFDGMGLKNVEIAQVSVTKARSVGAYHMMTAQNPVFIISGEGQG